MEDGNKMEIFITLTKYNTSQPSEEDKRLQMVYYLISILPYLSHVPPNWRGRHKAFLRWVRACDRCPYTPCAFKNTSNPSAFLRKVASQATGDKLGTSRDGYILG